MLSIAKVRLLGGRPCLDLVNTVEARRDRWGPDLLVAYDDLLVWSERVVLLEPNELKEARSASAAVPEQAKTEVERVRTLREVMAEVFSARVEQRPVPAQTFASLNSEIDAARRHQTLVPTPSQFNWTWYGEAPLERVRHRVALDAAALLTSPSQLERVKLCTGPNCGWLFFDETRNGSRRWCREEGCGTHMRMLRYRAKKR